MPKHGYGLVMSIAVFMLTGMAWAVDPAASFPAFTTPTGCECPVASCCVGCCEWTRYQQIQCEPAQDYLVNGVCKYAGLSGTIQETDIQVVALKAALQADYILYGQYPMVTIAAWFAMHCELLPCSPIGQRWSYASTGSCAQIQQGTTPCTADTTNKYPGCQIDFGNPVVCQSWWGNY